MQKRDSVKNQCLDGKTENQIVRCGKVEAQCPYFVELGRMGIKCAENIPIHGASASLRFPGNIERDTYYRTYCTGDYRNCPIAWAVLCWYNVGVECPGKDRCGQCGWNPDVAIRRLNTLIHEMLIHWK